MFVASSTLSSLSTYLIRTICRPKRGKRNGPSPEELDENYASASVSHWVRRVDGDTPEIDGGELVLLLRERDFKDVW